MKKELPTTSEDLSLELLNSVIGEQNPELLLSDYTVTEMHQWGSGLASSAGRIVIAPTYAQASETPRPRHIVLKVARIDPMNTPARRRSRGALYANEVNVYTRLKPEALVESPLCLGGVYDAETHSFLLMLEDLRDRDVSFANVTVPTSLDRLRSLLEQLAILHAHYWNSPQLQTSLSWMEAHTRGDLCNMFNHPEAAPASIRDQINTVQFKREMVERMGTTVDQLFHNFQRVQQHQARLPQTVCHGDTHIGNTYILPGDKGGLIDWQLASQGYAMHDIAYLIPTALSVQQRRAHERELIAYYREQLLSRGVADAPSLDTLWLEYRRAVVWGVYIGWLTTPVVNYGWEITVMNHLRIMTAYEDLESEQAIAALR